MLMAEWAGKGHKVFCGPTRQHARFRYFQRTGALITTTGQNDDQIVIPGFLNYTFTRLRRAPTTRGRCTSLLGRTRAACRASAARGRSMTRR